MNYRVMPSVRKFFDEKKPGQERPYFYKEMEGTIAKRLEAKEAWSALPSDDKAAFKKLQK